MDSCYNSEHFSNYLNAHCDYYCSYCLQIIFNFCLNGMIAWYYFVCFDQDHKFFPPKVLPGMDFPISICLSKFTQVNYSSLLSNLTFANPYFMKTLTKYKVKVKLRVWLKFICKNEVLLDME